MTKKHIVDDFADEEESIRKKKISIKQTPEEESQAKYFFQQHVFDDDFRNNLKKEVAESVPYKWGTINNLIEDDLLRNVRSEIMSEIEFTKKETDIYKVFQSGDLANLSAMPPSLLKRLPSLYKLRSVIYSETFRNFISDVTGCGKLSGIKTDLSIQLYTKGCHLLTHDDVIGSRRVSFILYMPDPDSHWKTHYGGGLQLFDSLVPNVPQSDVHSKLVPNFNQIAFFTVQPGLSFHAVEEVKVDKQRLSLQGWFHIPQKGEDGYIPGEQEKTERLSTLQQLESKELREFDFPKLKYSRIANPTPASESKLSKLDVEYLSEYMNPSLLTDDSISRLGQIFNDESVVDVMSFLNKEYESLLHKQMKNLELNEYPRMPANQAEVEKSFPWKLAIPSHKQRFMYIDGTEFEDIKGSESIAKLNQVKDFNNNVNFSMISQLLELKKQVTDKDYESALVEDPNLLRPYDVTQKLCALASMFKSKSFRKWLSQITKLRLMKDNVLIRRFRPGQDFILATKSTEDYDLSDTTEYMEGVLESTLNITPSSGWESGEWGGYELCLVDDDVAEREESRTINDDDVELNEDEAAIYRTADQDSVVYEGQASWNKFSIMYRDPTVMKFVKYVSYAAPGSRWDINMTWKCIDDAID
ncbi:hypothetical protein CANINC_001896 [Pichia inconspicua]|uniref:uS12 prolyl 3,4-dihydroxylase n=1 Tax=Pichia inconspicua TaxID=52247 RepID=A0A4T0X2G6_9ASCO|nr:hypothetical protein CANINC_001896 [[Candida] inconspicua]